MVCPNHSVPVFVQKNEYKHQMDGRTRKETL